jgi:predicted extracellular nuclease
LDANNNEMTGVIYQWLSSAPTVLQLDENGLGKALRPGTTAVIAIARNARSSPSMVAVIEPTPTPESSPSPSPSPMATPTPAILISEFRTRGPNGASDEFVELYNDSDLDVDISGWKIRGSSSSGVLSNRLTISPGTIIPARRHFLAANSTGYGGPIAPDQTFTSGFANDGGLAVTLPNDLVIDQVGLSSGSSFREGTHLSPLPSDASQSYERRPGGLQGSTQDTNNNVADFQLVTPGDPQNLLSDARPGPLPSPTSTPTPTPTATPSPSPSPSPVPTSTPFPTPSPTPTASPKVVISEFRTRGPNGSSDEFIEIYNASDAIVDISGWKLRGSSNSGIITTRLTVNSGTRMMSHGHFLATNSAGYSGNAAGDQSYVSGFANDGGVALTLPDDTILDQVGLSAGSAFLEGMHLAPLPSDTNQSYERKPGDMAGSVQDSGDNLSDFVFLTPSDPQNSGSTPAPSPSPTPSTTPSPSPSPSASPTPTPNPSPSPSPSAGPSIVISQFYGGGGNTGATFRNDFIEIFNNGSSTVSLAGWSVQYASAAASTWSVTNLPSIELAPGQHYLIQEASGGSNGLILPAPDITGTIAMAVSAGKLALVRNASTLVGSCPNDPNIVDLLGYGSTATCFRGSAPASATSSTTALIRVGDGCTNSGNSSSDFMSGTPNPRSSSSPLGPCSNALAWRAIASNYLESWPSALRILFVNVGTPVRIDEFD